MLILGLGIRDSGFGIRDSVIRDSGFGIRDLVIRDLVIRDWIW